MDKFFEFQKNTKPKFKDRFPFDCCVYWFSDIQYFKSFIQNLFYFYKKENKNFNKSCWCNTFTNLSINIQIERRRYHPLDYPLVHVTENFDNAIFVISLKQNELSSNLRLCSDDRRRVFHEKKSHYSELIYCISIKTTNRTERKLIRNFQSTSIIISYSIKWIF